MSEKFTFNKENLIALILFLFAYLVGQSISDVTVCVLLILSGIASYIIFLKSSGNFADLRGLLTASWEIGLGLAALRLSELHSPWTFEASLCFGIFPVIFLLSSAIEIKRKNEKKLVVTEKFIDRLEKLILITAVICLLFFIAEIIILGYVPIFSEDTHAYNYFHVTGLHYFTVSSVMTHSLTAIYVCTKRKLGIKNIKKCIIAANIVSFVQTIMLVSKFQLLISVAIPAIILIVQNPVKDFRKLPWKKIIPVCIVTFVLGIAAVAAMTMLRHYEPGYLNDIFEFRNQETPIYIQYPYMYIANNYANFNCMTENITTLSLGLRQLFPVIALTGLKFIYPQLAGYSIFVVKEELNTLTLIYDAYYDFGIWGVVGFALILGMLAGYLVRRIRHSTHPLLYMFYGQLAMYFGLSFFSAWFSVPTTWYWFGVTFLYYLVLKGGIRHE